MIDKVFALLAKVPTTKARIVVTIGLTIATGVMYFATTFDPSIAWLGFLTVMAGLDVSQHALKRYTTHKPIELARAEVIRNGNDIDIDEIIDEINEEATTDNPEIG